MFSLTPGMADRNLSSASSSGEIPEAELGLDPDAIASVVNQVSAPRTG